jgi:hypothetical protein
MCIFGSILLLMCFFHFLFGLMGIVKDGKNYFQNTVDIIVKFSRKSKEDILKRAAKVHNLYN